MNLKSGHDPRERYGPRQFISSASGVLPYRLLRPQCQERDRKYPLLLFMHGAGERGVDNEIQLVHGAADIASAENLERYPCFIVAPQCPEDEQWVDTPWTVPSHKMPEHPTGPMQLTLELVASLQTEFPVDERRLYITGISMGGFGVWDAIQRGPDLFAAAVPICGGGDVSLASRIARIPLWAFHGGQDPEVNPQRSRDMITAMREAGGTPRYSEYPEGEHDSWTETYRNPELYAWLFSQQR